MAINDETVEAVGAAPSVTGIGAGLPPNDPEAQARMQEAMKLSGRDYARVGLMGAAAGAQAGQGAMNPLSAFIQGAAMGLQAPAQIYNEKRKQIQSTIDATPFGVTHPEIAAYGPYKILAGLPTAIALEVIGGVAKEAVKVNEENKAKESQMFKQQEIDQQNKLFDMRLKTKDPLSIKDQIGLAKDFEGLTAVKDYQIVKPAYEAIIGATGPAGDKTMLVNFARLLSPTIRVTEGTMQTVDISSLFDKNTAGLWAKAARGEDLQPEERAIIRKEATRLYNLKEKDFTETSHLWKEKAAEAGFDPRIISGSFGKAIPKIDPETNETIYVVKGTDGRYYEVGE